jgi:hypothetical protein
MPDKPNLLTLLEDATKDMNKTQLIRFSNELNTRLANMIHEAAEAAKKGPARERAPRKEKDDDDPQD